MTTPERPPPPDPDKPYIWVGGQWLLVATDTSDGVPDRLDLDTAKGLDPDERDAHHALLIADPPTRVAVLEELAKHLPGKHDQSSHGRGGGTPRTNMAGGPLRSSIPGTPGGPPVPRASLAAAKTTGEVAAVTSAELERIMGRPVPVDFAGLDPDVARETGEGLLMVAERYPANDLRSVTTYGPGGTSLSNPGDPMYEAAAITKVVYAGSGQDEMAFNTVGGSAVLRGQYQASASMGSLTAPSPTGTAVHEMGHVVSLHSSADITSTQAIIDHATAAGHASSDQDISAHVARSISIYAASGPEEAMAEAFADVLVNGTGPGGASPLSQQVFGIIDSYVQANNP